MAEHSGEKGETPDALKRSDLEPSARSHEEARDGLSMAPELMLDLARKAAELMVERIEGLPQKNAWEGDFQQIHADQLMEDPPEDWPIGSGGPGKGRTRDPANRVAVRSPPSILVRPDGAHVARGAGRLHGRRVQRQLSHLADRERSDPTRVGRHRLVPALARLSGERRRAFH